MSTPPREGINLLRFAPVEAVIRSRWFPTAFQIATLAGFVSLLLLGWGQSAPAGVASKLFAKSNLVTLVVWGLWWPAMVWLTVLFGRVWCAVCPLELVAGWSERAGRRLGVRQRSVTAWLRAGWLVLFFYGLIQMLVAGMGLHRSPAHTSLLLLVLLFLAVLVGLLSRHRAFCLGFCPVGLLLGTYGRGSMLAVRADHSPAGSAPPPAGSLEGVARSCPSLLNPPKLNSSKDCLLCGECITASPDGEMALLLRPPYSRSNSRGPAASWPVTLFVILVSGFVTYELTTNWAAGKELFLWIPSQVALLLGLPAANGWIGGVWKLLVYPLILWTLLGGLTRITGGANSLGAAWRVLALPAAVIVAAGHMTKGLEKLATWGGFLPQALLEPIGVQASLGSFRRVVPEPAPLLPMATLSVLGLALLAAGLWFGIRELRLSDARGYRPRVFALVLLWLVFSFLVLQW